ncbi:class A beta-lactamase-related serine hydrolase [Streptomyces laculatispora]|uniref:Class A beta-lactamase-related serine hydrolase n=1 Tax=Streptomyces laculatispora TaxID=887464 RepID=A0ABY9I6V1_9ACTN|nr:serine hydrolase [Streptomyces laculatispora]WLQ42520.1 class A beta-lactamase-related serine hydrolase [Streptomyces laculatispora]
MTDPRTRHHPGPYAHPQARDRIRAAFAEAGVTGRLHAVDIDSGAQIDAGADRPVVTASVHKLCLLVALHQQAEAGRLVLTEQTECPRDGRTAGPTGLAAMLDAARVSLRDAAYLMVAVSDNTAADLLLERVGLDAVNDTTRRLGLTRTHATRTFREFLATIREDAGNGGPRALADPQVVARLRAVDPARTNRSTSRDMTRLLGAIWRDEACTPEPTPRRPEGPDCDAGPTTRAYDAGPAASSRASSAAATCRRSCGPVLIPSAPTVFRSSATRTQAASTMAAPV